MSKVVKNQLTYRAPYLTAPVEPVKKQFLFRGRVYFKKFMCKYSFLYRLDRWFSRLNGFTRVILGPYIACCSV